MLLEALPPPDLFVPFLIAGLALNFTPGSDMTFVALAGARGGRRTGVAAAAGIFTGCLGHILFAVVGLSALIATSQTAFALVKWVGVAYLLYLAWQLLRDDVEDSEQGKPAARFTALQAFRQAAIINLLNPKVGIFFLAFLPQFIETGQPAPWRQILVLGLVFNATGFIVNTAVGSFSAAASQRVARNPYAGRVARWFAATVMGGLAIRLALSRTDQ